MVSPGRSSFDFQVGGTTYLFSSLEGPTELTIGYWHISVMTLIASLLVLVLGLVLVPFSVETKVFTVFAVAFGLLFAGLFSPSMVNSWLLAARLGIAGVIAVWLVVWLLYLRRTVQFRPAAPPQPVAAPAVAIVDGRASASTRPRTRPGIRGGIAMACSESLRGPSRVAGRMFVIACTATCLLGNCVPSAVAQVPGGPPRIRNVYIPSDQLKVLFGNSSQGVLMPREKIMALWQEARAAEQSRSELPADTILTQANYDARLDDHELRITGRIQFEALRAGWHAIDLPFGGLAIESARLGDQPAQFGRKDDGTLFLLHREQGRFALELEMSAPLASKGGDLAVTLKLPPVSASEFALELRRGQATADGETR